MQTDFEERILRNPAFAAILLWRFARAFHSESGRSPTLAHAALAMPLLFHRQTVKRLHRMNFGSGLIHAVASTIDITTDLQRRAIETTPILLRSLQTACSSGLLQCHRSHDALPTLHPNRTSNIGVLEPTAEGAGHMVDTARRLGVWFARMPLQDICGLLRVRF